MLSSVQIAPAIASETNTLVAGILMRSEQIQTLKFHVNYSMQRNGIPEGTPVYGVRVDGSVRTLVFMGEIEKRWPVREHEKSIHVIYGPSQFRIRYDGKANTRIVRNGRAFTYTESTSTKAQHRSYLLLEARDFEARENHAAEGVIVDVLRGGSFPSSRMRDFVRSNSLSCRLVGEENSTDGMRQVLEWRLTQDQVMEVFQTPPDYLFRGATSIMRIRVLAEKGFAISGLEFENSAGEVKWRMHGEDFRSVGDGIYLPFAWSIVSKSLPNWFDERFTIESASDANVPLTEEDFSLSLPKGTFVRSELPGKRGGFKVAAADSLSEIDTVLKHGLEAEVGNRPAALWSRWVVGVSSILVLCVVSWVIYRQKLSGDV